MTHYDADYYNAGSAPLRYWPPGMDYERWCALPARERQHVAMLSYTGPSGAGWEGFDGVLDMLRAALLGDDGGHFRSVLDIGCSTGVFLEHCLNAGITDVHGVDVSEWAIAHPLRAELAGRLHVANVGAGDLPDAIPERCHLVSAFDFLEHVFEAAAPAALAEIKRRADPFAAFCVCTAEPSRPAEQWSAEKGPWSGAPHLDTDGHPLEWVERLGAVDVPPEREWQAVSGHVTIRPHSWWCEQIEAVGMAVRWDAMHRFEQARRERSGFCYGMGAGRFIPAGSQVPVPFPGGTVDQVASWGPRFVIFAERRKPGRPKGRGRK